MYNLLNDTNYFEGRRAIQALLRDRCWSKIPSSAGMLDTGYWKFRNALMVKSENIQYPTTSIQDQPMLELVFVATAWIEYKILCNYRVNFSH